MRDAVICAAVRTPVGRRKGGLRDVHAVDLGAVALRALAERSGIDPAVVDDVHWGCVTQVGEQAFCVGRQVVLAAGWPETVPAVTVDRQCGSSQQALHQAAAAVISGQADVVVAGGVESMTRVPMGANFLNGPGVPFGPAVEQRYADRLASTGGTFNQGLGAELIAEKWGLGRTRLDEYALASHAKAAAAQDAGAFDEEIVPVPLPDGSAVTRDEGVRRDSTLDALAGLKPAFRPDGVVTAASSSQISDGAAALLVTTSERARELGLTPIARVAATAVLGDDPVLMLTAPIPATAVALRRAGLTVADIGAFEVNEAFAAVPLAWLVETGADPERLNPLGGAIALGHPLGASGARLTTTLLHHMRRNGIRYGLQTMCEGGGMANATVFELL
ncbi:thiolase family protein [Streptoalloteichus hindustanus]|uniref:Acetyl-CoA acyltransferase n=1 Tax=Streptoalloteichus hindustanus TaxID=2017 RepID=A0A1M4V5P7_STRHI|nr:thiolase family protein [Streptoalloteichus hindustanus]SHE64203.1 acetyl-CoA acyltransferase [Streptoalloteichus hindustanus]